MQKVLLYIGTFLSVITIALLAFYHNSERTYISQNPNQIVTEQDEESQESTVTFGVVGDIMLSRNVAGKIAQAKDPLLPFRGMDEFLSANDFNFANLESPFSGRDDFNPSGSLVFNVPRANIAGLDKYFAILSLANNHAFDQGKAGLDYTEQYLADYGIVGIGTGETKQTAWEGNVILRNGLGIGFIAASYASVNDGGKATNDNVARIEDVDKLPGAINFLKPLSDFIIVSMHAGTEYERKPNQSQINFARAAIDAGADMVIGHHPHWIQTIEQYKGKYIFYSLGNFIFDQEWSPDTKEGLALKVQATKTNDQQKVSLKKIELVPVIIENYCCPRPANETEKQTILQKINITNPVISF